MTFEDFAKWVAGQIFDNNVDDGVFCELACRKLAELGLVEKTDTRWIFTSADDLHSHCIRCGKELKNPVAKERGYGEVCWKKHLKDNQQTLF